MSSDVGFRVFCKPCALILVQTTWQKDPDGLPTLPRNSTLAGLDSWSLPPRTKKLLGSSLRLAHWPKILIALKFVRYFLEAWSQLMSRAHSSSSRPHNSLKTN